MNYRLVVTSDIHHAHYLRDILPIVNSSDYFIFCGDGLGNVMAQSGSITVPMVCVRGNNDWTSRIDDVANIVIGETNALVTHGHRYGVRQGLDVLLSVAKQKCCSLVLFGHTHIYCDTVKDGIHFINPGALCDGSYAIVEGDGKSFKCRRLQAN